MFFEMYDKKGGEVAEIIKDAAQENASVKADSAQPEALRDRVQALQRRKTVIIEDAELTAINAEHDDEYARVSAEGSQP